MFSALDWSLLQSVCSWLLEWLASSVFKISWRAKVAEFSWCKLCALCRQGILVYSFCTVSFGGVGWSPGVTITTESCMYVFLGRTMLKWIPCFPACCVWLTASLPYATAALTQGDYGSRRKKKIHLLMLSQQFLRTSSTWRSVVFRWSSQAGECWTKKEKKCDLFTHILTLHFEIGVQIFQIRFKAGNWTLFQICIEEFCGFFKDHFKIVSLP